MKREYDSDEQGFDYHPGLLYREGVKRVLLPEWSRWLMALGRWLVTDRQPGKVARAAVSVPAPGYAALFAAMGVLSGSYQSGVLSAEDRLRMLSRMNQGDPVRYSKKGPEFKVSFGMFDKIEEDPYFGEEVVWIVEGKKRYARKVGEFRYIDQVHAEEGFKTDRGISRSGKFVKAVTGVDPIDREFFSRWECLIIGNKKALTEELVLELELDGLRGKAGDLLRVHEQRTRDGYRSRMISAQTDPGTEVLGELFGGVVLDGSRAVLRWRGKVRKYPWLAVIDRTAPTARAAKDEIMSGLATSIEDAHPPLGAPPSGIEALYYWDRKR